LIEKNNIASNDLAGILIKLTTMLTI